MAVWTAALKFTRLPTKTNELSVFVPFFIRIKYKLLKMQATPADKGKKRVQKAV